MERESQYVHIRSYLGAGKTIPKLLTPKEAEEATTVKAERLIELAESGYAPCVRVDNGPPLFFRMDIVAWCKDHLFFIQDGKSISKPIALAVNDPDAVYNELPDVLKPMFGRLKVLPAIISHCVYFLVKEKQVVYVGQTACLANRILTHLKTKYFDKVFYLPVPDSELNETEGAFIRALAPIYNASPGPASPNQEQILTTYGIQDGEESV